MAKITNPVALELMAATGVKSKAREPETKLRERLVTIAGDEEFEGYDDLSDEAKTWLDAGIDAVNDEKEPPEFPEVEEAEAEEVEEAEAEEAPRRKKKKSKKTATKAEPKKKTTRAGSKGSAVATLRMLVCKYPKKSKDEIFEMLDDDGAEMGENTKVATYYLTVGVIKTLVGLGLLEEDRIPHGGRRKAEAKAAPATKKRTTTKKKTGRKTKRRVA